jgi:hypothetical protein
LSVFRWKIKKFRLKLIHSFTGLWSPTAGGV